MKYTRKKKSKKKSRKKKIGGKIIDSKYCSKLVLNCDKKYTDGNLDEDDGDCNYYFDINGNMCRNSKFYKVLTSKKGLQCRKSANDGIKKCDLSRLNSEYLDKLLQELDTEIFGDNKFFIFNQEKLNLDEFVSKFLEFPKRTKSKNGIIIYHDLNDIDINFEDCFLSKEIYDLLNDHNEKELLKIYNILNNLLNLNVEYKKTWSDDEKSVLLLLQYNLFKNQSLSSSYKKLLEIYIKSANLISCWFGLKELINIYNQLNDINNKNQLAKIQILISNLLKNPNSVLKYVNKNIGYNVIDSFLETIEKQIIPIYYQNLNKTQSTPHTSKSSSSRGESSSSRGESSRQSSESSSQSKEPIKDSKQNYYDIFGIKEDASDIDIKNAYKKLALYWHPDKCPDLEKKDPLDDNKMKNCENHFKLLQNIYSILSDPIQRRNYNLTLNKSDYKTPNKSRKTTSPTSSSNYTRKSSQPTPTPSTSRTSPPRPSTSRTSPSRASPSSNTPSKDSYSQFIINPSWTRSEDGKQFQYVINQLNKSKGLSEELKSALSNVKPGLLGKKFEIPDYSSLISESQTEREDPNDPSKTFTIDTETTKYIQKYFKPPLHSMYGEDYY